MRVLAFAVLVLLSLGIAPRDACAEPPQQSAANATTAESCAAGCRTKHMRSIPLFVTGVLFDVVGGTATAGGIGLIAAGAGCQSGQGAYDGRDDRGGGCGAAGALVSLAGVAAIVGGSVFLAIGIPLTVVGGTSVPDAKSAASPSQRLHVGGNGLSLVF